MNYTRRNIIAFVVSICAAVVIIALFTAFIGGKTAGNMLLGRTDSAYYPLTLQNLMHLIFFIGIGQLWVRWLSTYEENLLLKMSGFLPEENGKTLTTKEEIEAIQKNVANVAVRGEAFLPDLINTCILQFSQSYSVSDTIAVLNSSLELNIHRLELRYSLSRYIVWAIPTFGFIGTVIGISSALGNMDINKFLGSHIDKVTQFRALTIDLGFAFDTTIVALGLSAILVFMMHLIQKGEEESLNKVGRYVLTNFINRLSLENMRKKG